MSEQGDENAQAKNRQAESEAPAKGRGASKSKASSKGAPKGDYVPRLKTRFREELVQRIMEDRGYTNPMQVPRLDKIVVNMGVGDAVREARLLDAAVEDLQTITGQKALVTKARKSIAGFKLREGMSIGAKVTLRGDYMWEFLDRLLSIALPRIRDFRGLSPASFDGRGNYSLGVREQIIFPEIDYDDVEAIRGLDVTITTSADLDEEALALLRELGLPYRSEAQ